MLVNVHSNNEFSIFTESEVNGPGKRNVLHLQGCSIKCAGCFSKHTWDPAKGYKLLADYVARLLLHNNPDGITISGGEPFDQEEAVHDLCLKIREADPDISIIAFSGYPFEKIKHSELIEELDAVIAGPYIAKKKIHEGLRGSANQEVILLTDKHTMEEFEGPNEVEFLIDSGTVTITGFPDEDVVSSVKGTLEEEDVSSDNM